MKTFISRQSHTVRRLTSLVLLLGLAPLASAQAIASFEGKTDDAKYDSQSELKLSILEWSPDEEQQATLDAWRAWQDSGDASALLEVLESHNTLGYLFTGEVTGYAIKYAHQGADGDAVLLVVPGLKTKNRYMWESAAPVDAPPFTLLQLESDGDGTVVLKSSLDAGMRLSEDGSSLRVGEGASEFGTLADATPYYLEEGRS